MHEWDSRPDKPDHSQWTMLVGAVVIIAAVAVFGVFM